MNHLIEGCDRAINNIPKKRPCENVYCEQWTSDYILGLERAKDHYERGGNIFNRPIGLI